MKENKHMSVHGRVLGDDASEMVPWYQVDPFLIIGLTILTIMAVQIFLMTSSFGRLVDVEVIASSALAILFLYMNANLMSVAREQQVASTLEKTLAWGLVLLVFCVQLGVLGEMFLAPAQSWDGLSFWYDDAARVFEASEAGRPTDLMEGRHGSIASTLLAAGIVGRAETPYTAAHINWFLAYIGVASFIAWAAKDACWPPLPRLILVNMTLSLPLFQNHAIQFGYTELFVTLAVVSACAFTLNGLNKGNSATIVLGVVLSLLPVILRNTGFTYSFVLLVALTAANFSYKKVFTVAGVLGATAIFYLYGSGAQLPIAGNVLGAYDIESHSFFIAGYKVYLRATTPSEIFQVWYHKIFLNQSFSISIVAVLVTAWAVLKSHGLWRLGSVYILTCLALGMGMITLSLFIDYGYRFAAPNHDTGSSRFTMPYMCLAFLFVSSVPFKRFTLSACSR